MGADVNVKDGQGHNIVHLASMHGFEGILVYLCGVCKMSYTETDVHGRTPLHLAALEGQASTGILLLAWSEDLNQQDIESFTPLHLSVLSQSYKLVRNLIIKGADKTIKDNTNKTPLDIALNREDLHIIKLLVSFI
jgi:ankyrin repeat protein